MLPVNLARRSAFGLIFLNPFIIWADILNSAILFYIEARACLPTPSSVGLLDYSDLHCDGHLVQLYKFVWELLWRPGNHMYGVSNSLVCCPFHAG